MVKKTSRRKTVRSDSSAKERLLRLELESKVFKWKVTAIVFIVLFIVAAVFIALPKQSAYSKVLSKSDAEKLVMDYINNVVLANTGVQATSQGIRDEGLFYVITIDLQGKQIESYVTKDGQYLFPTAIKLSEQQAVPYGSNQGQGTQQAKVEVSVDDDPMMGNPDAPITIIEFSDFQCPFCRRFYTQTLKQLKADYVDTGKVRFVYRDFPLMSIHPYALKTAIAAECADEQGKFWEYHNKIFDEQNNGKQLTTENLKQWAQELGLDMQKFNSCLDSEKYKDEVMKDFQDGQKAGVSGTPTLFINGIKLVGAQPYENVKAIIDQELAKVQG